MEPLHRSGSFLMPALPFPLPVPILPTIIAPRTLKRIFPSLGSFQRKAPLFHGAYSHLLDS